jgi:hypothetical protein
MGGTQPDEDRRAAPTAQLLALAIVQIHIALVTALGQYYAKIEIPVAGLTLYPTDLAVATAFVLGFRGFVTVPWDTITKLVVAFLSFGVVWVVLDGLGGMQAAGAKAFSFFVYSVFYFVIRTTARDRRSRWRILNVIAFAAVVGALLGLVQKTTGTPVFAWAKDFETTTTGSIRWLPGDFALYAMLAIIAVAVTAIVERKLGTMSATLLAASSTELLLAQHRSAFVAVAVALFVTMVVVGVSARALAGIARLAIVVGIAIAAVVWVFGGSYLEDTLTRIQHTSDLGDANIDWRLMSAYEVLDGVVSKPLGHGFAVWDFFFNMDDPLTGSHNSLLDLAYRIGAPGLVTFLAIPTVAIRRTRQLVRRDGAIEHRLSITICSAMLAFLVFASFNMVLEAPYMSILFWVLLGVGAGELADASNDAASASSIGSGLTTTAIVRSAHAHSSVTAGTSEQ